MTTWVAIAAVALAALSLVLFVLALRRLLSRQAEVTVTMLRRYDERLATFAQSLNDALTTFQSPAPLGALDLADDPEPMVRALELARNGPRPTGRSRSSRAGTGRRSSRPSACRSRRQPHRPDGLPGLPRRPRDRGGVLRRPGGARGAGFRQGRASSCRSSATRRHRVFSGCSPATGSAGSARRTSTRSRAWSASHGRRSLGR